MPTSASEHELKEPRRSRKWRWIALLLSMCALISLTVAGCGLYAAYKMKETLEESGYSESWTEGEDGETVEDISYGDSDEWNKVDMFFPRVLSPEKSRGAFVYVHGGSWIGGSRRDMRGFARRMAKEGYVSASVEYTLYKEKRTDSYYSIFLVLDEIDAALAKIKATASERGIELDRVALGGDSAGGHIISLYAYSRGKNAPLPVAFIAPRVGPIDFHADAWTTASPEAIGMIVALMNHRSKIISSTQLKNPDDEIEKLIDAVSPLSYLSSENTTPTVAAYGGQDPVVGTGHCAKLRAKFKELGAKSITEAGEEDAVVFDCLEYPHSGHMLARDSDYAKKFYELTLKYAERYLNDKPSEEK